MNHTIFKIKCKFISIPIYKIIVSQYNNLHDINPQNQHVNTYEYKRHNFFWCLEVCIATP